MQVITATELRTKSKDLIVTLLAGQSVDLIHRSRLIGTFRPVDEIKKPLTLKAMEEIEVLLKKIKPEKLIPRNKRDEVYRKNLGEKYAEHLS